MRQSERWSLPDDVFGNVPGDTRTISPAGRPTALDTLRATSLRIGLGVVVALSLAAAALTRMVARWEMEG